MAGTVVPCFLVVFCAVLRLSCASTLPKDMFPTDDENHIEILKTSDYLPSSNIQNLGQTELEDKPKNCFHFFVSRNMSSLLADATKMLRTIRDRREREWILTFIYRIKSLAEHLRSHPESKNYDCLPTDEEAKKRILSDNIKGPQQPEIYFVDDVPKRSPDTEEVAEKALDKSSKDNHDISLSSTEEGQSFSSTPPKQEPEIMTKNTDYILPISKPQTESSLEVLAATEEISHLESSSEQVESLNQDEVAKNHLDEVNKSNEKKDVSLKTAPYDNSIVVSSPIDCNSKPECFRSRLPSRTVSDESYDDPDGMYPPYQPENPESQDFNTAEFYRQEALKERIKKALLEELAPEVKKLQTVGGTREDLTNLWNSNVPEDKLQEQDENTDFDYEEQGAAVGDLNMNERVQPDRTVAPSLDEVQNSKENGKDSYEPYDDSDALVQQLFEVRFDEPPPKTTKSLGDQNNDYLITSTHIPF